MTSDQSFEQNRSVRVAVAAHKAYWMPSDPMYLPIQVGAEGKPSIEGFTRDDQGTNISAKNSRYCELTALYWAERNLSERYIGLVHYRRHFAGSGERKTLTDHEALELLNRAPLVLPKRREYGIETIESHYSHTHDARHLEALRSAVTEIEPRYSKALERHLSERGSHMFNMMIMRHDLLSEFCTWMFPILQTTEQLIDFEGLTPFEERLMGRLSELLIDVWVEVNGIPYVECPVKSMEPTPWLKKGCSFMAAKLFGRKYRGSFR